MTSLLLPVSSFLLLLFLSVSVEGFGVGQRLLQQDSRGTTAPSITALHVDPISVQETIAASDSAHSMWVATIDSDIANIQLEEFRKVFAGGIAVMVGGFLSTTLLGTIIEKKDLYANLAAESYIDMADDPNFWKQMTEGMDPEEQEKAKELMAKIKAKRAGEIDEQSLAVPTDASETAISIESGSSSSSETEKDETAKASNDMFSDY